MFNNNRRLGMALARQVTSDFFSWQDSWSQGFKRLRVSLKSKKTSKQYSYSNITGKPMKRSLNEMIMKLETIKKMMHGNQFVCQASRVLRIHFDDTRSTLRYRDARAWCHRNCSTPWNFAARRSERDATGSSPAVFSFASAQEAAAFTVAEARGWR